MLGGCNRPPATRACRYLEFGILELPEVCDEINAMLGVDGEEEAAVYMLAVGKV